MKNAEWSEGGVLPSLHYSKEGWLRPLIKYREATIAGRRRGGFPFGSIGKPPRPREQWSCATFY